MLKIRLMRIGTKKKPFYRVVAVDERNKRTGGYIELLGTYDPLTEPKDIKLKQDRIDYWIKQGAQMSDGFLRIIGKAPQRPPRKPKKEKKESSDVSLQTSDKKEEQKAEEVKAPVAETAPTEEKPAEEALKEEAPATEQPAEASAKTVISSESQNESGDSSPAPESVQDQNDAKKEEEPKDEGSA